ncbi:MAG: hypothetical protein R3D85_01985 [Paracoccaceae bacterium]
MRRIWAALAVAVAVAGQVGAGELAPRWQAIGQIEVEIGGETRVLVISHDRENDSSEAEQRMIMGSFLTINAVGRTVSAEGKPGSPMVQVTVQGKNGAFDLLSVEMFDEQGFDAPMVIGPDGGQGALTALSFENDHLDAAITGAFQRLTGYSKGDPAPAEGVAPVPVTIRLSVDVPPLK